MTDEGYVFFFILYLYGTRKRRNLSGSLTNLIVTIAFAQAPFVFFFSLLILVPFRFLSGLLGERSPHSWFTPAADSVPPVHLDLTSDRRRV